VHLVGDLFKLNVKPRCQKVKKTKRREENLNGNRRIKREIIDEKAKQYRMDVRTERLRRQRGEKQKAKEKQNKNSGG
jgi:hypothetical protein